jgi:DNA-binding transcriptional ArsR family regulator
MSKRSVDAKLVPLFRALANPVRRTMLDRLREEAMTTGGLAEELKLSRFTVMQHLRVLVTAGLVLPRKRGRERWNHLNAVPLQQMYERWVRPYEAAWAAGLVGLKEKLEKEKPMAESCSIVGVELEVTIDATRERVWKALLEETTHWWRRDFCVSPDAKAFRIEPRVGGRMFEDWGNDAGVLWGTVLVLDPLSTLELLCHTTPRFGGPRMSMLRLSLTTRGDATVLTVFDTVMGRTDDRTAGHLDEGWRALFGDALKSWVESHR